MSNQLTHLSLFTGIGGLDLAAEMAGFRTVGQCEWADYPTKVLEKHWPGVPRWKDIHALTGGDFYARTGMRTVDVISGGFPCQPFSVAGKRRGKEDDRYLWPEMLRVIEEIRPSWVVGENVAGIVSMALDTVLSDLERIGYSARAVIIPAAAVDAAHRRDRCAIVAYADYGQRNDTDKKIQSRWLATYNSREDVSDAKSIGLQGDRASREQVSVSRSEKAQPERRCDVLSDTDNRGRTLRRDGELPAVEESGGAWANHGGGAQEHVTGERRSAQPGLGGVADGASRWLDRGMSAPGYWMPEPDISRLTTKREHRKDRLQCLGNAVVPQQFYPVFLAIAEMERLEALKDDC